MDAAGVPPHEAGIIAACSANSGQVCRWSSRAGAACAPISAYASAFFASAFFALAAGFFLAAVFLAGALAAAFFAAASFFAATS